jgi:hypothetical protein
MFAGRFLVIVPVLCIAGMLVAKGRVPPAMGTMPTHGPLFVALLVGTVLIVGGLTFFPAAGAWSDRGAFRDGQRHPLCGAVRRDRVPVAIRWRPDRTVLRDALVRPPSPMAV